MLRSRASLKQWIPDISESAVETFLQNGAVAYDATTEIIITQKYVSLFTVGYESWHEYRRTGYPLLVMGEAIRNDGVHRPVSPTRWCCVRPTRTMRPSWPKWAKTT